MKLQDFKERMISRNRDMRPNTSEILLILKQLKLNFSELIENFEVNQFTQLEFDEQTIVNYFYYYFMKEKCQHYSKQRETNMNIAEIEFELNKSSMDIGLVQKVNEYKNVYYENIIVDFDNSETFIQMLPKIINNLLKHQRLILRRQYHNNFYLYFINLP